jgi:hypothetical protein
MSVAGPAAAADGELDLDARLVSVNGPLPIIDGGLGNTRFGGDQSGVHLGRARFAITQSVGEAPRPNSTGSAAAVATISTSA